MPRVLLLVHHRGNRRLLQTWVEQSLRADAISAPETPDDDVDLVVADAAAFARDRDRIERLRSRSRPAFLPCLLVATPREAERLTLESWRQADDVVVTPIRPEELRIRLERLMSQRADSLATEAERTELRRSNVDLERFAFVAAHELVAPLTVVRGAVQTVGARFTGGDEPAKAVLETAVEGCERMQVLIENILDLSRAGRGGSRQEVATTALVDDVCAELRDRAAASGTVVTYADLPVVTADPAQLRLVFRNLIANAVKFARPGVPARVEITAARSGAHWQFCVADNGIGIEDDDRQKVFDLFNRAGRSNHVPGTGIGLAICQRIVERAGGRIWIEPGDEQGTVFCFTVPA
ncbi:MAG TPA: ATP-binding protein [Gaiellaceae bacterium]